ncbi:transposase [Actinoplanes sp. GCM10030250]|uniref:IS110 family transposase n=1 Tax=Actinoplanes sp. GCM10030250 TaxID=3273376 RepID=UPI003617C21C
MARVVIGVDPHKRSATIEIMSHREKAIGQGRFGTDREGYQAMLAAGRKHTDRIWAVEGCSGIGRHVAQRLVADGETVLDVPAKLSTRARVFATGQGRKTDPVDAHSVAVAALRTDNLRQVPVESAVPPRPHSVRFVLEMAVSALWWFAAWAGCYVYVASTADAVPSCDGSGCFSSRDWALAGVIFYGSFLALVGAALSAAVVAVVVATASRLRWPTGVVGTAVTWTAWLVLAGVIALLVSYPTLR